MCKGGGDFQLGHPDICVVSQRLRRRVQTVRMPTNRRLIVTLLLPLAAFTVLLAGCGDDSGDSGPDAGSSSDAAESSVGADTSDATPGGVGHWSALELCSLSDPDAVGALFPGTDVVEATGIDDPDWSACTWKDPDADPLAPESTR